MKSEWIDILNQVKAGELSAEEGAARLKQLEEQSETGAGTVEEPAAASHAGAANAGSGNDAASEQPRVVAAEESAADERLKRWQRWWLYPFWAGLGIFMLGATLMAWSSTNERLFWMACAWLPLLVGLLVLVLAAWSRTARWVHVRVNDPGKDGEKPTRVAISMPIPVTLTGWGLRVFGPMIPQFKEKNLDKIGPVLEALRDNHDPLTVEVDDKDGEKVQVYIV